MAREYVSASQNIPIEDIAVELDFAAIGPLTDVTARVKKMVDERQRAADLERAAGTAATALARDLATADVPMRNIGAILGVSHQRAHQLVSAG